MLALRSHSHDVTGIVQAIWRRMLIFGKRAASQSCYNFVIVEATMSSPRSRRRISEIISGGKLFGLM